jgi:hypothetical protein
MQAYTSVATWGNFLTQTNAIGQTTNLIYNGHGSSNLCLEEHPALGLNQPQTISKSAAKET